MITRLAENMGIGLAKKCGVGGGVICYNKCGIFYFVIVVNPSV